MILWKLTDARDRTWGYTEWGPGVTHGANRPAQPAVLCTDTVIHAYRSPELAEMMDPIHASYGLSGHLWRAEGEPVIDDGIKLGCRSLTTIKRVRRRRPTNAQRIRFAILAAQAVVGDTMRAWSAWAARWLDGSDRSAAATRAAWAAAWAAWAATRAAWAEAAWAAARAAWAAAEAAEAARAWARAEAATRAAWAAAEAAEAAAEAVGAARPLDLTVLARQAMADES